jgi:F-type H+-transporting ATPase subunit delta
MMKWHAKLRVHASSSAGKSANWRSKAPHGYWDEKSILRRTLICWINWPQRLPVAERATIARPYAKAAFEYALEMKSFAEWSQGLRAAAEIVADPRLAALTKDPQWSQADLVSIITDVAGDKLNSAMQNFVRVLAENHRLLLLPEIFAHYEKFRSDVENTVDVDVISAIALSSAQQDNLAAALSKRLKRQVRMQNSVDATLLGGAVVRAGDLVIDGSLKGRLQRLATELGS